MRKAIHVSGDSPAELALNYNQAMDELDGCEILREKDNPDGSLTIFFETGEDPVEEVRRRAEAAFLERNPIVEVEDEYAQREVIEITIRATVPDDRHCCECDNYSWGRGCPYRRGHIQLNDPACGMFNVIIERR